jgi:flagellar motor switch protein FliG
MANVEEHSIISIDDLSGPQRAAVLIMVLDEAAARKVLEHMSVREVEEMGRAVAEVENVEPRVIEQLVAEFVKDLVRASMLPKSGREFALDVLPDLLGGERGEKVGGVLRRAFSTDFQDFCSGQPPRTLAALLRDEHPQTQAVALLMMGSDSAAKVLSHMEEAERFELSVRMARIETIPSAIADDIERTFKDALDQQGSDRWTVPGIDRTAQTLGRLAKPASEPLLDQIMDVDPELSDTLRRRMVTFKDLTVLDDRSMQMLLKQIDRQTLIVALRGVDSAMRELFLKNMSSRAATDLREEIELLPPMPRSEINKAQEEIVQLVQRLAAEGVIRLYLGSDELV